MEATVKNRKLQMISLFTVALLHLLLFISIQKPFSKTKISVKEDSAVSLGFKKFTKSKAVQGKLIKGLRYDYMKPVDKRMAFDKVGNYGDETGKVFGRDSTFYDYLYDYILQRIYCPRVFMHLEVEGHVKARLAFDKNGRLVRDKLKITGSNRYMVAYLRELFIEMFKKPVPHKILDNDHPFSIIDVAVKFIYESKDSTKNLSYRRGREFGYVRSNHFIAMKGLAISPGEIWERIKENYTEKGKVRKKFWKERMKEKI